MDGCKLFILFLQLKAQYTMGVVEKYWAAERDHG